MVQLFVDRRTLRSLFSLHTPAIVCDEELSGKAVYVEANLGLQFWLTRWNHTPSIYIGVALMLGYYFYAIGPLRRKYDLADTVNRGQVVAFVLGMSIILLALVSPLDALGDYYLFSVHMV